MSSKRLLFCWKHYDLKSIKNIRPGDTVLSYNEKTGQSELNKVIAIRGKISNQLIRYTFANGVVLESTKDHPYYVNGFNIASYDPIKTTEKYNFNLDIDMIKVGDVVNLPNGDTTYIEDIEELFESEKVYTFEVENNHNYYANGILVHNKGFLQICCYNDVTAQYATINNYGPGHPGCCCLGANWVEVTPSDCNLNPGP
jgi:intein/homing endonuclease